MVLVSAYSEFLTHEDEQAPGVTPDPRAIGDFTQWLHHLADGLDGELVLVAIEQKPDEDQSLTRIRRFAVGDNDRMSDAALVEARKEWTLAARQRAAHPRARR